MSTTMRQMLEAGVHFGHQTRYWNPKMAPYIFGHRNKIHIINLEKTLAMYNEALKFVRKLAANRGVDSVRRHQAPGARDRARRSAAVRLPFVDYRWLGGMLTQLQDREAVDQAAEGDGEMAIGDGSVERMPKKEALHFQREHAKLERSLGGIKTWKGCPMRCS